MESLLIARAAGEGSRVLSLSLSLQVYHAIREVVGTAAASWASFELVETRWLSRKRGGGGGGRREKGAEGVLIANPTGAEEFQISSIVACDGSGRSVPEK